MNHNQTNSCTAEALALMREIFRDSRLHSVRRPKTYTVFGLTDELAKAVGLNPHVSRAGLVIACLCCPYTTVLAYAVAHAVVPTADTADSATTDTTTTGAK